jgi:enoyl-CoA hydratase/carnithine racemase
MAFAAGCAGNPAGAGRSTAGRTLDRQRTRDAAGAGISAACRGSLSDWARPMARPHGELMTQAMKVAEHIAGLSPMAARMVKESLNTGLNMPLDEAAHADLYRFMALELTEDKAEGHRAWRERRKPQFKGR